MAPKPSTRAEPVVEPRDIDWQQVRRRVAASVVAFDKRPLRSASGRRSSFKLESAAERAELARLTALAPSTRNYKDVRSLLSLLRGADMLLQLDDDEQAEVVGALRASSYEKGAVVATEQHSGVSNDAYLLLVEGVLTVLVRDTGV